jgi:hypothetical protein
VTITRKRKHTAAAARTLAVRIDLLFANGRDYLTPLRGDQRPWPDRARIPMDRSPSPVFETDRAAELERCFAMLRQASRAS